MFVTIFLMKGKAFEGVKPLLGWGGGVGVSHLPWILFPWMSKGSILCMREF